MTSHLSADDLVLLYYGELAPREDAAAGEHLGACRSCRAEYSRLQQVLGAVNETSLPAADFPPSFERTVWARLEPDLRTGRRGKMSWLLLSPAPLALATAVLVLVAGAFFAGRALSPRTPSPAEDEAVLAGEQMRERVLLMDLGEHFERSQMVLVELVSSKAEGGMDISGERERAEQLVASSRLYRRAAEETGNLAVSQLLDEIERVLTEVAASPERLSPGELADVQRRIESRDLIFKLQVVSSEVRERQREALRRRMAQRS